MSPDLAEYGMIVWSMQKGDDMGKLRSLDDIVSVEGYPGYVCLLPYLRRSLELICESRGKVLHPDSHIMLKVSTDPTITIEYYSILITSYM